MDLITQELNAAQQYQLKIVGGLLDLTPNNVALVEAMVANDSDYAQAGNANAVPLGKYKGSTAYWMTQLKKTLLNNDVNIANIMKEAVLAVDRENSTHISADHYGPEVLTDRLLTRKDTLINDLKDRKKGFALIKLLSHKTFEEDKLVVEGKTYFPRENYSFATKFCHYACLFFFNNEDECEYRDNYSIYDGIVVKALPIYLKGKNIKKKNGKEYRKGDFDTAEKYPLYSEMIDILRNNKISRNGFDHLLWYFHKAR